MDNQPTINIGVIGSVSNGKSTIVRGLTSIDTQRHSTEKKGNKTIKLGYANAKFYQCLKCNKPECYQSAPSDTMSAKCMICSSDVVLRKHVSFVDSPGHNSLMKVMLNGTSVMHYGLLIGSVGNKDMPAPQTKEHLLAAKMIGLDIKLVCMNKMDLVKKDKAIEKITEFKKYLVESDSVAKNLPIVPIAGNYGINKDVLCQYICEMIDEPVLDLNTETKIIIIRSFNVNHPNTEIANMSGGVIGGTVMKGRLCIGDKIEILPGLIQRNTSDDSTSVWSYTSLRTTVMTIKTENNHLEHAIPGGLIGIQLTLDPGLTIRDGLVGNVARVINHNVKEEKYLVLENLRVVLEMMRDDCKINKGDFITINYNACNVNCAVVRVRKNKAELKLERPICAQEGDYITLSKQLGSSLALLGRAKIMEGDESTRLNI